MINNQTADKRRKRKDGSEGRPEAQQERQAQAIWRIPGDYAREWLEHASEAVKRTK